MKTKISLITASILLPIFFAGCNLKSDNVPVNDINFNKKEQIIQEKYIPMKTIGNYHFDINKTDTLNTILDKVRSETRMNILLDSSIPKSLCIKQDLYNITLQDYLNILEDISIQTRQLVKFKLISKGDIYKIVPEQMENKISEKIEKQILEEKLKNKKINVNAEMSYQEFIDILRNELGYTVIVSFKNKNKILQNIEMDYKGSLYDFFKEMEYKGIFNDVSMDENKIKIEFKDYIIKYFELKLPSFKMNNKGIENLSDSFNVYDSLETQIKTLIDATKTKYTVDKAQKMVVVEGNNEDIKKIETVIKNFNDIYSKTVNIELTFFQVDLDRNSEYGVNLASIIPNVRFLGKNFDMSLGTNLMDFSKTADNIFTIKETGKVDPNSVIKLLNQFGETHTTQKPTITVTNNIPTTLNLIRTRDYVSKIDETFTAGTTTTGTTVPAGTTTPTTGATTTGSFSTKKIETKELKTGFVLNLMPSIEKDNDTINLIIAPNLSDGGTTEYIYSSGAPDVNGKLPTNTIALRDINQIDFGSGQAIKIKNGQTAVIGGYFKTNEKDIKKTVPGVGKENNILDYALSDKNKVVSNSELIIFITATIGN